MKANNKKSPENGQKPQRQNQRPAPWHPVTSEQLVHGFAGLCEGAVKRLGAESLEFECVSKRNCEIFYSSEYIDFDSSDSRKKYDRITAALGFRDYNIYFNYCVLGNTFVPPSTLYAEISFSNSPHVIMTRKRQDRNDYMVIESEDNNRLRIMLCDIIPHLDTSGSDLDCLFFPCIRNTDILLRCFDVICNKLRDYQSAIVSAANDSSRLAKILAQERYRICDVFGADTFDRDNADFLPRTLELYRLWTLSRFNTGAYRDFLRGYYAKAAKKYRRMKYKSEYEIKIAALAGRLAEAEESAGASGAEGVAVNAGNSGIDEKYTPIKDRVLYGIYCTRGTRSDMRLVANAQLFAFLIGYLVLGALLMLPYTGIYMLFARLAIPDAIYYTALEPYNALFSAVPAILTAIPLSFFIRKPIYRILFWRRGQYRRVIENDSITVTSTTKSFIKGMFYVILTLSIVFIALMANTGIAFTEIGVIDKSGLFTLHGTLYYWYDIDSVWEIEGRVNGYGEWLDAPSYVILTDSGEKIDLYEFTEHEDMKKGALGIFERYCPAVREHGILKCRSIDLLS